MLTAALLSGTDELLKIFDDYASGTSFWSDSTEMFQLYLELQKDPDLELTSSVKLKLNDVTHVDAPLTYHVDAPLPTHVDAPPTVDQIIAATRGKQNVCVRVCKSMCKGSVDEESNTRAHWWIRKPDAHVDYGLKLTNW